MTTLEGNDTSRWQLQADWAGAARASGFIIAKATEGTSEVDRNYLATITAERAAGKPCGSYHYTDGGDPVAEAAFYVAHNGRRDGELQVLDFEGVVLHHADPVGYAVTWCTRVYLLSGNLPLIYMNGATLHAYDWSRLVRLNVGLWLASWGNVKPASGQWPFIILWQHTDSGRLAGISTAVDGDTFYGDAATWRRYGSTRAVTPATPAPAPAPHHPPAPRPAPAPPHRPGAGVYEVQQDDTLAEIAVRYGLSQQALIAANVHAYPTLNHQPDYIQTGWHLTIPGRIVAPPVGPAPVYVPVHDRDTLSGIAAAHHTDLATVLRLNPRLRAHPDHIEAGQTVRVR